MNGGQRTMDALRAQNTSEQKNQSTLQGGYRRIIGHSVTLLGPKGRICSKVKNNVYYEWSGFSQFSNPNFPTCHSGRNRVINSWWTSYVLIICTKFQIGPLGHTGSLHSAAYPLVQELNRRLQEILDFAQEGYRGAQEIFYFSIVYYEFLFFHNILTW